VQKNFIFSREEICLIHKKSFFEFSGRLDDLFRSISPLIKSEKSLLLLEDMRTVSDSIWRCKFGDFNQIPFNVIDKHRHARRNNIFVSTILGLHCYFAEKLFILKEQSLQLISSFCLLSLHCGLLIYF
jgi:hypothetical protein